MQQSDQMVYRLRLSEGFLNEARQDLALKRWRSCVDNSQLAVENAAKVFLAYLGPVGRTHNPAELLERALRARQFPQAWRAKAQRVTTSPDSLAPPFMPRAIMVIKKQGGHRRISSMRLPPGRPWKSARRQSRWREESLNKEGRYGPWDRGSFTAHIYPRRQIRQLDSCRAMYHTCLLTAVRSNSSPGNGVSTHSRIYAAAGAEGRSSRERQLSLLDRLFRRQHFLGWSGGEACVTSRRRTRRVRSCR
jgi:hypothetical protein